LIPPCFLFSEIGKKKAKGKKEKRRKEKEKAKCCPLFALLLAHPSS